MNSSLLELGRPIVKICTQTLLGPGTELHGNFS